MNIPKYRCEKTWNSESEFLRKFRGQGLDQLENYSLKFQVRDLLLRCYLLLWLSLYKTLSRFFNRDFLLVDGGVVLKK